MLTSFRRPDATSLNYKTDAELRYIIDNRENYLPESVLGAMTELKNRGTQFSDEEMRVVEEDMQARMDIALKLHNHQPFLPIQVVIYRLMILMLTSYTQEE